MKLIVCGAWERVTREVGYESRQSGDVCCLRQSDGVLERRQQRHGVLMRNMRRSGLIAAKVRVMSLGLRLARVVMLMLLWKTVWWRRGCFVWKGGISNLNSAPFHVSKRRSEVN